MSSIYVYMEEGVHLFGVTLWKGQRLWKGSIAQGGVKNEVLLETYGFLGVLDEAPF